MAKPREINYQPAGKTLRDFHMSNAPCRYLQGPVGSGKSVAAALEILSRAREQKPDSNGVRASRWAVVRNSYPILRTTTVRTWLDWLPEDVFGAVRYDSPISHHLKFRMPDGTLVDAEILFLALDKEADAKKLLSLELTGAWLNEGRELRRDTFDLLQTRVGRFPAQRDGGPTWSGVFIDSNPPSTDHWLHRQFVKARPKSWDFFQQPSGRSPEAENLPNLPADYYTKISEGKDDEWVKCFVDGEFGFASSGRPVHQSFRYSTHVFDDPVEPKPNWETLAGIDFGLTPAAVILQREPGSGRLIVLDELTTNEAGGVAAAEFARQLRRLLNTRYPNIEPQIYGDPAGSQRAQTDAQTVFDVLRANQVFAQPASSNDLDLRLETVNRLLTTLAMDGKPALMFSPSCEAVISALSGGYRYTRLQVSGDERYRDTPEKNSHSHVADTLQYALLGGGEGYVTTGGEPYKDNPGWDEDIVYPEVRGGLFGRNRR